MWEAQQAGMGGGSTDIMTHEICRKVEEKPYCPAFLPCAFLWGHPRGNLFETPHACPPTYMCCQSASLKYLQRSVPEGRGVHYKVEMLSLIQETPRPGAPGPTVGTDTLSPTSPTMLHRAREGDEIIPIKRL